MVFTEFHEKTKRRRASWPTIRPENYVVFVRIAPAFEEVKEEMLWTDINISCVRTVLP